jgi:hypothetical protein
MKYKMLVQQSKINIGSVTVSNKLEMNRFLPLGKVFLPCNERCFKTSSSDSPFISAAVV